MPQFTSEGIDKNRELLSLLQAIAAEKQATPAQISLAWMLCKKPYIVPIPGTRKLERLIENGKAAEVLLTEQEISKLDRALNEMEMSEVFGGSRLNKNACLTIDLSARRSTQMSIKVKTKGGLQG